MITNDPLVHLILLPFLILGGGGGGGWLGAYCIFLFKGGELIRSWALNQISLGNVNFNKKILIKSSQKVIGVLTSRKH